MTQGGGLQFVKKKANCFHVFRRKHVKANYFKVRQLSSVLPTKVRALVCLYKHRERGVFHKIIFWQMTLFMLLMDLGTTIGR